MKTYILPSLLTVALALTSVACGSSSSSKAKSYPGTEAGLVSMINDVRTGAFKGDLAESLAVPDAWLTETYGDELGKRFIEEKNQRLKPMFGSLQKVLQAQYARGRNIVTANKFDGESDEATTLQNYSMKAMKKKSPIFSVHMREKSKPNGGMHLYSWVYVDGTWRFLSRGLPTLKLTRLPADAQKRAFLESSKATRDRIFSGKK
jgi:hypothetical protein